MWVDGADDGSHVDQLGRDVAVDDPFEVGYPIPEVIDAFDGAFELAWGSAQIRKCLVERFVPEALFAGVVAPGQDKLPPADLLVGDGGHAVLLCLNPLEDAD